MFESGASKACRSGPLEPPVGFETVSVRSQIYADMSQSTTASLPIATFGSQTVLCIIKTFHGAVPTTTRSPQPCSFPAQDVASNIPTTTGDPIIILESGFVSAINCYVNHSLVPDSQKN